MKQVSFAEDLYPKEKVLSNDRSSPELDPSQIKNVDTEMNKAMRKLDIPRKNDDSLRWSQKAIVMDGFDQKEGKRGLGEKS